MSETLVNIPRLVVLVVVFSRALAGYGHLDYKGFSGHAGHGHKVVLTRARDAKANLLTIFKYFKSTIILDILISNDGDLFSRATATAAVTWITKVG